MRRAAKDKNDTEKNGGTLKEYLWKVDPTAPPPSLRGYIKDETPNAIDDIAVDDSKDDEDAPYQEIKTPSLRGYIEPEDLTVKREVPPKVELPLVTPNIAPKIVTSEIDAEIDAEITKAIGSNVPFTTSEKPKATPDSAAKINFLHTFFDRIEKTVKDLHIEDSNGRTAEAFRERATRLVSNLSDVLPLNIASGTILDGNIAAAFPVVYKSPASVKRVVVDWSEWIEETSIVSSSWLVPSELTQSNMANGPQQTTVFIGGGELGKSYNITNRIKDALGRIEERSITVMVTQT